MADVSHADPGSDAADVVRLGVIGAGGIFRSHHIPNLKQIPGVELVAVANRTAESSARAASMFGFAETMDDWRRLVARDDLDAVMIGTWPYTHREMSIAALEAGKHVFCQARMARDLAEARDMLDASEKRPGLVAMICPPPHRMPFEPFIRETLASGRLGVITGIELVHTSASNLNPDAVTWREQVEYSGLQTLAMGIFAETLNAWVGPYHSLFAQTATPIPQKRDGGELTRIEIPQVVTIAGRLTSGVLCHEHHTGVIADKTTPRAEITIWGLGGTLRHRFLTDEIELAMAGEPLKRVEPPTEQRNPWRVEQDFIDAVRAARRGETWRVSPDFREGLAYMTKVQAVHESARSGQSIELATL